MAIRKATQHDIPAIADIYSHYVLHESCTFEVEPPSLDELRSRMLRVHELGLPYLVADAGDAVAGYAYASRYRERPAYRHTIENSVYVARARHRLGVGRMLLDALIQQCTGGDFLQMIAVIGDSRNKASIALHERAGFRMVGVLEDVGFKHGRWIDTVLMQRCLC